MATTETPKLVYKEVCLLQAIEEHPTIGALADAMRTARVMNHMSVMEFLGTLRNKKLVKVAKPKPTMTRHEIDALPVALTPAGLAHPDRKTAAVDDTLEEMLGPRPKAPKAPKAPRREPDYITDIGAAGAAVDAGRPNAAVLQRPDGLYVVGSRRAGEKKGYTFIARAGKLRAAIGKK